MADSNPHTCPKMILKAVRQERRLYFRPHCAVCKAPSLRPPFLLACGATRVDFSVRFDPTRSPSSLASLARGRPPNACARLTANEDFHPKVSIGKHRSSGSLADSRRCRPTVGDAARRSASPRSRRSGSPSVRIRRRPTVRIDGVSQVEHELHEAELFWFMYFPFCPYHPHYSP